MPAPVERKLSWKPFKVRVKIDDKYETWDGFSYGDSLFGIIPPSKDWSGHEQTYSVIHIATGWNAGQFLREREDAERFASTLDTRFRGIFEGDDANVIQQRILANEDLAVWYLTCKTLGAFVDPDSL